MFIFKIKISKFFYYKYIFLNNYYYLFIVLLNLIYWYYHLRFNLYISKFKYTAKNNQIIYGNKSLAAMLSSLYIIKNSLNVNNNNKIISYNAIFML